MAIHSALAALFGAVFAFLTYPVRRYSRLVAVAGIVYGGLVYRIDFQVLARYVHQFHALFLASQPLVLAVHLFYGGLVAAVLLPSASPRPAAPAQPHRAVTLHPPAR
jgi:hypothetical protein